MLISRRIAKYSVVCGVFPPGLVQYVEEMASDAQCTAWSGEVRVLCEEIRECSSLDLKPVGYRGVPVLEGRLKWQSR